jgi:topoisomerase-4 subunit B
MSAEYTEDNIKSLDWKEHIRLRPGMYIGKLGNGSSPDDGIYILIKEVIDNSIDEYVMGFGKKVKKRHCAESKKNHMHETKVKRPP